jgi:hypothetical protein
MVVRLSSRFREWLVVQAEVYQRCDSAAMRKIHSGIEKRNEEKFSLPHSPR